MRVSARAATVSAIGRLSQKIQGHETPSTTAPPRSGPRGTLTPRTPVKIPIAFGRAGGGNASLSSATASGMISAAPAPCTARAAISEPASGATAHPTEAAANRPRPPANRRRRPKRSPSAAAVIISTAKLRT